MEDTRSEFLHRFPGLWPGTVVDDDDPDKDGRLRIRIDQVYGAPDETPRIEDGDLPWARPCMPVSGASGEGDFFVPQKGASVWVTFWGGNPERPVWVGGWFTPKATPDAAKSSYSKGPKTRVVRTVNGHFFEMRWKDDEKRIELATEGGLGIKLDDTNEKIIVQSKKTTITLDDSGEQLTVSVDGKAVIDISGDATITVGGDAKLSASGALEFDGTASAKVATDGPLELDGVTSAKIATPGPLDAEGGPTARLAAAAVSVEGITTIGTPSGPKFQLIDIRFLPLFNTHFHGSTPILTTPPVIPTLGNVANTNDTTAS